MSREVRRVPLDFEYPLRKVWSGYIQPEWLDEEKCMSCDGSGYSPYARRLMDRWYGKVPFDPSETGSTPLTPESPEVDRLARHHVANDSWFYGTGETAVHKEAERLAALWNGSWSHHLAQEDVDVLVAAGRLMDFTHTWSRETRWQPIEPKPVVTAEQVNRWSLMGFGHDSLNCGYVVSAACQRAGEPDTCAICDGHGSVERYPGQRAEAEAWQETEPPTGPGYQLWETVSEGSPVSPVFKTPAQLANWIIVWGGDLDGKNTPYDDLVKWIKKDGVSVGTFITTGDGKMVSGVEAAARKDEL
jgi:hypothetical protein